MQGNKGVINGITGRSEIIGMIITMLIGIMMASVTDPI